MPTQQELMSPTPEQIKERAKLWADELRKNPRKAIRRMRDDDGGRCCLCVAEDVAISCGLEVEEAEIIDFYPKWQTALFFGWTPESNETGDDEFNQPPPLKWQELSVNATALNDDYDLSHTEIADLVEANYLKE